MISPASNNKGGGPAPTNPNGENFDLLPQRIFQRIQLESNLTLPRGGGGSLSNTLNASNVAGVGGGGLLQALNNSPSAVIVENPSLISNLSRHSRTSVESNQSLVIRMVARQGKQDEDLKQILESYLTLHNNLRRFEIEPGLTLQAAKMTPAVAAAANLPNASSAQQESFHKKIYELAVLVSEFSHICNRVLERLEESIDAKDSTQDKLNDAINQITDIKHERQKNDLLQNTINNLDKMLQEEVKKRTGFENELAKMKESFDRLQLRYRESKRKLNKEAQPVITDQKTVDYEALMRERDEQIDQLQEKCSVLECEADEWKVLGIKAQRRWEDTEKHRIQLLQENNVLAQSETSLKEKCDLLQRKLKETTERLQQYTDIYQATKKDDDQRKSEVEELNSKLEDQAKQLETMSRQRKQLQTEFSATVKQKQDLFEKNRTLEAIVHKREKEVEDFKGKLADSTKDYETKLERCEERIFALTEKLNEAESKKSRQTGVDPMIIMEMENKLKAKDDLHMAEVNNYMGQLREKETFIAGLNVKIEELKAGQFTPRMERLRKIETEIKDKIEEYALAEESLETQLLCLRCAKVFVKPCTMVPCGHSYCKECMLLSQEENYGRLACESCEESPTTFFFNETLDSIVEMFKKRKELSASFLNWIHNLEISAT